MAYSPNNEGPARYSRSYSRSRSRSPGGHGPPSHGGEDNNHTIFCGNLNHEASEEAIRDFFQQWGKVMEVKIIRDMETGRPRGFGFIKFDDPRDASDAISEGDGKNFLGRTLKLNLARYPRGGPPRGGFRGGFHGGPPFRGGRGGGRYGGAPYPPYGGGRRSRSRSVGRYSPGRYSPGRPSPGRSDSYSRSRSRSPGPPAHKRHRVRSPAPPPSRAEIRKAIPPVAAAPAKQPPRKAGSPAGSYSSYTSGSSYSTTDSELSRSPKARKPAAPAPPVAPPAAAAGGSAAVVPGHIKKELTAAKRRESELSMRTAALEAQVEQAQNSRQELQQLVDEKEAKLAEKEAKLQKSEEACKQYRKWLGALADYSRAALLGREAVKEAMKAAEAENSAREEELGLFLAEADAFLSSQRSHRSGRRRRSERRPEGAGGSVKPEGAEHVDAPVDAQAGANGDAGGWDADMEVDPTQNGAATEHSAAAKFKPGIKFKLAS